ncbi:MAG: accessory factor UbiK family protein [Kiloniellaceae bacterium]
MQSQNKILDDMAKVAGSAMGVAAGMRAEVEARFREQMERLLTQMDLVPRDEFDAMKAVAVAAREAQESLSGQVAALEQRLADLEAASKAGPRTPQKTTAQKATAQKTAAQRPAGSGAAPKGDAKGDG